MQAGSEDVQREAQVALAGEGGHRPGVGAPRAPCPRSTAPGLVRTSPIKVRFQVWLIRIASLAKGHSHLGKMPFPTYANEMKSR